MIDNLLALDLSGLLGTSHETTTTAAPTTTTTPPPPPPNTNTAPTLNTSEVSTSVSDFTTSTLGRILDDILRAGAILVVFIGLARAAFKMFGKGGSGWGEAGKMMLKHLVGAILLWWALTFISWLIVLGAIIVNAVLSFADRFLPDA